MVVFNGFNKGVIGKKLPSDTTLNNMRTAELIKLLHIAEDNHKALASFYVNAVAYSKRIDANIDKALEELKSEKCEYDCTANEFQRGAKTGAYYIRCKAIEIVEKIRKE